IAAVAASLALLALALWADPLIARIPEPVLAAIVIAALTHALDPAPIAHLWRIRRDHWIALSAAVGVLLLGVLNGMLAAIALSIAHLLYELAHPSISALGQVGDSHDFVDMARHKDASPLPGVGIFRPNAPLIFANAESTLAAIAATARASAAPVVVLSLEESNDLDATALEALCEFVSDLAKHGQQVVLARAHDRVRDVLVAAGRADLATGSTFSVADAAARADTLSHIRWQDAEL
ncbi:MAG TPA: STAS domain-containing protein, partial [Novosphingobium sp.]|nr:STAS domain-containing protein [Novosphingobium sp.]